MIFCSELYSLHFKKSKYLQQINQYITKLYNIKYAILIYFNLVELNIKKFNIQCLFFISTI